MIPPLSNTIGYRRINSAYRDKAPAIDERKFQGGDIVLGLPEVFPTENVFMEKPTAYRVSVTPHKPGPPTIEFIEI